MARLLALRLAPNRRWLSTATAYAAKTFAEVLRDEPSEARREKLKYLQGLWEQQERVREELVKRRDDEARATKEQVKATEELVRVSKIVIENAERTRVALTRELLCAKGHNNTLGLLEYLLDQVLAKHSTIAGKRGSETMWSLILQDDPELELCLRSHLAASTNFAAHLTEIYNILSQHVQTGKVLSQQDSKIIFEGEFLSPEQCKSLTCLGKAVLVEVEPAPCKSIADSV